MRQCDRIRPPFPSPSSSILLPLYSPLHLPKQSHKQLQHHPLLFHLPDLSCGCLLVLPFPRQGPVRAAVPSISRTHTSNATILLVRIKPTLVGKPALVALKKRRYPRCTSRSSVFFWHEFVEGLLRKEEHPYNLLYGRRMEDR